MTSLSLALGLALAIVGSLLGTVSETGTVSALTRYDPYGGARPGSTVGAGIGWTAEWRDPSGLVNLRARAYDPATARFVARDSYGGELGDPASANRYAFGAGSPLTTVDPSGHVVEHVLVEPRIAWSAALQSLPGIGDSYSFLAGTLGFDPIGGFALTPEERAGALATAILPGPAAYALGRLAQKVAGAVRRTDDLADAARAADGAGDVYGGVRTASKQLQAAGIPRAVRKQWLESFDVRTITTRQAGPTEFGIRSYGGRANSAGATLFRTFPASRGSLAIKPEWNDMSSFRQFQIREHALIIEGRAAPQGIGLPGGDFQMVVPSWRLDLLEVTHGG